MWYRGIHYQFAKMKNKGRRNNSYDHVSIFLLEQENISDAKLQD